MCIHRYKTLARFGLMHMIATNLCVWLENIVQETVREIQILQKVKDSTMANLTAATGIWFFHVQNTWMKY